MVKGMVSSNMPKKKANRKKEPCNRCKNRQKRNFKTLRKCRNCLHINPHLTTPSDNFEKEGE